LTSNQFYSARRLPVDSSRVVLQGEEHHHLARVARVKPGDSVWLFDETGTRCRARVETVHREGTELRIVERLAPGPDRLEIELGQSLVPPKAMDWIVQKATEWGVAVMIPVVTARSLRMGGEQAGKKVSRWRKLALEASKQSKRSKMPEIVPPLKLDEYVRERGDGKKIFLNENGGRPLRDILTAGLPENTDRAVRRVAVLVGPEGGWDAGEAEMIAAGGFESASLGDSILRAETAALSAVAMISHFWNM